jgi:hypothetical protein
MAAASLEKLQQHIARQETELQRLRRELEGRQNQLASLTRRKDELQAQLLKVENQIAAVATGSGKSRSSVAKPISRKPTSNERMTVPELILTALKEVGHPLTVRQLVDEIERRGFRSGSGNFLKLVGVRIFELRKKGLVRSAPDQAGYILTKAPKSGVGVSSVSDSRSEQPPLRVVLTRILQKSKRPLTGSELAKQALAAGYRTTSKNFTGVVFVLITKMPNIENVPGQGYRLKKGWSSSK